MAYAEVLYPPPIFSIWNEAALHPATPTDEYAVPFRYRVEFGVDAGTDAPIRCHMLLVGFPYPDKSAHPTPFP